LLCLIPCIATFHEALSSRSDEFPAALRFVAEWFLNLFVEHFFDVSIKWLPNLQDPGKLRIGENTLEMLNCDLSLEMDALPDLQDGIEYCESIRDHVSRDLFNDILESEEEHIDWLETQISLVENMGIENHLTEKIHEDSE
jgi:bacterioferritin